MNMVFHIPSTPIYSHFINLFRYAMGMNQCCQFRTVPAGTAGIYRTGQQSGTFDPPCFVPEKIPAVPANFGQYRPVPGVPAGTEKSFFILFFFFKFCNF